MSTLYLAFLGSPQILLNQQPVELSVAKMQALLAYLSLTRTPHHRDHLLSLLWAESHKDAARKNMRNRLWQLRQLLGEDVLTTLGDSMTLADWVQSDVAEFEAGMRQQLQLPVVESTTLRALLNLWRGPLLDGIHLSEAPDFEVWLTTERERLGQLYLRGLTALIQLCNSQEKWDEVVTLAQQGLRYDPLYEPFHQQLMTAFASQGQRSEALRQFEHLRTLLKREFEVDPLPETVALRERIAALPSEPIRTEPLPAQPQRAIPQPSVPAKYGALLTAHATLTPRNPPFIGRQEQVAALDLAYQQTLGGVRKVVLLSGEMGIGKSRLWQMWSSRLPADQLVLETRCLNTTQTVPLDPMRRLLDSPLCRQHFASVAATLLPVWQSGLLQLAPALQQSSLNVPVSIPSASEERLQVAEALTQFMRTFAAPRILFIDDLQWADEATLNWLLYFSDRMLDEPVLLVGTYRPEDAPPSLTRILAQWQREGILQRLQLPNFTRQESDDLLAALGSNTEMTEYLHSQSGGNPYYLTQLSDVAVDGIPSTLAELIQARLRYLPESVQPVLHAAAVLEPTIDLSTMRHTSQRGEEEILDALDFLQASGVLSERSERYEFTHPLVATVVRDGLSNGRRKLYHRRAAEGIATRYKDQLATVAGQLARHYSEAGETIEAARFAEMAGEEALRIGAHEEALAFFEQANRLEPTPARQLGIGLALNFVPGKLAEARQAMQQALEQSEAQGDCRGIVKAGLRLAASYIGTQDGAQVLYWTRRVLPDLETTDDPELQASAHYLMGTAKFRNGYSMSEAASHYATATKLVKEHKLESEIELMCWFEWGNLQLQMGEFAQAVEKFQIARQCAQRGQSILFEGLSLNNLAYALLQKGDLEAAQATIATGLAHAETYALLAARQYLFSTSGEIALAMGKIALAESQFQQALQLAEKYDNAAFVANLKAHLGRVAVAKGTWKEAEGYFVEAKAALNDNASRYLQLQITLWLSDLYLRQSDFANAQSNLQQAEAALVDGQYVSLVGEAALLRERLSRMQ